MDNELVLYIKERQLPLVMIRDITTSHLSWPDQGGPYFQSLIFGCGCVGGWVGGCVCVVTLYLHNQRSICFGA